jgi:PAS domain S-box-containing protein
MLYLIWKILISQPKRILELLIKLLDATCVYDEQGHVIYVSQRFLKMMRSTTEEIHFFDYFLSELMPLETLTTYWKRALAGEMIWLFPQVQDHSEQIECFLQFDPDLKRMILTSRPSNQNIYVHKLAEEYERLILILFKYPSLAVAFIDLDGNIIKCNQRLHELLGTNEGDSNLIEEFVHPQDQLMDAELRQKLLGGDVEFYTTEKCFVDRNNETIWVSLSVSLASLSIYGNTHQKYFVILFEDITETKKIYSALVRAEEKWKTFVSNSLNLFIQTSNTGQIVYASPSVERILGYKREELLDRYVSDLIHPHDLNRFELALNLWISEAKFNKLGIEIRWQTKSGLWACLYIQGQKIPISLEIDGLIIDGCDVTDRKFLEAELRATEEKFKFLSQNTSGAFFQCDLTYTLQYVADEIQAITGYPASEFIYNQGRSYTSIIHPEDVELVEDSMHQYRLEQHSYPIEYRIIHIDGRVRWISECKQGRLSVNGKLSGFDGILFDISEVKQDKSQTCITAKLPYPFIDL